MARYLETTEELRSAIKEFMSGVLPHLPVETHPAAAIRLGHIVNLAVRCNPRQSQGTVRKNIVATAMNIVATAMQDYCRVTMTKEEDPVTKCTFNKIHIQAK